MTAIIINQNSVGVHDGVETVGNGDDCTVGELLSDGLLDDAICPEGGGGEGAVCHASGSKVTFPFDIFISLPFELSSYLHQPHSYHLLATAIPSPTHSLVVNVGSGLVQH